MFCNEISIQAQQEILLFCYIPNSFGYHIIMWRDAPLDLRNLDQSMLRHERESSYILLNYSFNIMTPERKGSQPTATPIRVQKKLQEEKEEREKQLKLEQRKKELTQQRQLRETQEQKEIIEFLQKTNVMESLEDQHRKEAESIGKARLIELNHEYKERLAKLAQALDDQNNLKEQRKIIKTSIKKEPQPQSEALALKKIELRQQQAEIAKLEKHIFGLQRQLETNYDIFKVMAKEDELQMLKAEYAALLEERDAQVGGVKKSVKQQEFLKLEEMYNLKLKNLESNFAEAKHKNQELMTEVQHHENELKKLNKNISFKEERIKEMEAKIQERMKFPERKFYVSEEELTVLEARLQELESEQRHYEMMFNEKMRSMEQERKEKQKEADLKIISVRELEKELKMNQVKFKELAKLIRHNVLPPIEKKAVVQSPHPVEKVPLIPPKVDKQQQQQQQQQQPPPQKQGVPPQKESVPPQKESIPPPQKGGVPLPQKGNVPPPKK